MGRGREDRGGGRARNNARPGYTAEPGVTLATPEQLRAAAASDVPPEILARYTALPNTVPSRVIDLAFEITTPADAGPTGSGDAQRRGKRHQQETGL